MWTLLNLLIAGTLQLPTCPAGTSRREVSTPEAREARCELPDGTRQGPRWAWYPSGQPWFQGEYAADKRTGAWKFWYPNGAVMASGTYRDDRAEGAFIRWHDNGQKALVGQCVAGREDGPWVRYWPNGKEEIAALLRDGKPVGPLRLFSRRGGPVDEVGYVREKAPGALPGSARYREAVEASRPEVVFQECRG